MTAPAVARRLKALVRRGDVAVQLPDFDGKLHVTKIRREIERVIRAALRGAMFLALDFYFLLEGILLRVVVHVPPKRDPEFINEIVACFLFLILRREIEVFVRFEVSDELFYPGEGIVKSRHVRGRSVAAPTPQSKSQLL